MATWVGAIVETKERSDLSALGARYHIALGEGAGARSWILVEGDVGLGSLGIPAFAEGLSRELGGTVIAFAIQTAGSAEAIEHWDNGQLLRKLTYVGDEGGWVTAMGTPQPWEVPYFFADGQTTTDNALWPENLGDELGDDEIARYERARGAKDAPQIMDLLQGGSTRSLGRLCAHLGVDPAKPDACYQPKPRLSPRVILIAVAIFLFGMLVLGVLAGW